ncbi:MAG: hypothetical protein HFI44_07975 [Lachnospiraceae bacterium]|nr:hypothetical protein [Lachnospiraceae bacterium]
MELPGIGVREGIGRGILARRVWDKLLFSASGKKSAISLTELVDTKGIRHGCRIKSHETPTSNSVSEIRFCDEAENNSLSHTRRAKIPLPIPCPTPCLHFPHFLLFIR